MFNLNDDFFIFYKNEIFFSSIFLFTFLALFIFSKFISFIKGSELYQGVIVKSLVDVVKTPVNIFVTAYMLTFILGKFGIENGLISENLIIGIKNSIIIFGIANILIKTARRIEFNILLVDSEGSRHNFNGIDKTSIGAIVKIVSVTVWISVAILMMDVLGISPSALLAFGGVGGMILALGARSTLSNIFSGTTLYLDKNFRIGDWVESKDQTISGTISRLGWARTEILDLDGTPTYCPNDLLQSLIIENNTRRKKRRIEFHLDLNSYDPYVIKSICSEIEEFVKSHKDIDPRLGIHCRLESINKGARIKVKVFTRYVESAPFFELKEQILLKVLEIVKEQNVEIIFHKEIGES